MKMEKEQIYNVVRDFLREWSRSFCNGKWSPLSKKQEIEIARELSEWLSYEKAKEIRQ